MVKKNKDEVPNPNSVSNRDTIQRLNFLYQASTYLNSINPEQQDSAHPSASKAEEGLPLSKKAKKRVRNRQRHPTTCADLSRSYVESMKIIGQKTTVKMDPAVKRTLCKGCNIVLIPGSSAKVRVHPSRTHGHTVTYTCMSCGTLRRIPAPPTVAVEKASPNGVPASASAPKVPKPPPPNRIIYAPSLRLHYKEKKPPMARPPPLFERKVGHVVFRGNERLVEVDEGQH